MSVYDSGLFLQDVSAFPLWDAGFFRFDFSNTQTIDCDGWIGYIGVVGVDVSAAGVLLGLMPASEFLPRIQACVQELQALSAGVMFSFDPAILAMDLITQVILSARQASGLITALTLKKNIELQIASLQIAYRLLQRSAAGLN